MDGQLHWVRTFVKEADDAMMKILVASEGRGWGFIREMYYLITVSYQKSRYFLRLERRVISQHLQRKLPRHQVAEQSTKFPTICILNKYLL